MSSRLLGFSLCLNLVLLGVAEYWIGKSHSGSSKPPVTPEISQTNLFARKSSEPARVVSVSLRWSELESKDYRTYVANLRKAGCPEPVLRRIIGAELKELYGQKAFALVQEFHRDFWEIAARKNVRAYFEKTLAQKVEALCREPDALLNQLVGEAVPEASTITSASRAPDSRLTDFLSPAKREQLRQLTEHYEIKVQAVRKADLSPEEKESQLAQLHREMETEQAQMLSPDERAEYQLRKSDAAGEVQQLYGVDFSETELRCLAKAIDNYHRELDSRAETDPEMLEQNLRAILGPRFAEFNCARSASYRELYEVVSDFGQPSEAAAEIFDLRLQSEQQCDEIRADKNRTTEEKQALLDELEEQVDQTVLTKLGAGAYQSYKAKGGGWINSLGRL